jgi:hypothetical protein
MWPFTSAYHLSGDLELPGADISWVDKLDPTESTPQTNLNQPQTGFVEGKEPEEEGWQDFDRLEVLVGPVGFEPTT